MRRLHIIGAYLSPHDNQENWKGKQLIKDHAIRIWREFPEDELIMAGDWNMIHIKEINELSDILNMS